MSSLAAHSAGLLLPHKKGSIMAGNNQKPLTPIKSEAVINFLQRAELLTEREFAELFGYTPETLVNIKARGLLPAHVRLGRRNFFTFRAIAEWIARGGSPTHGSVTAQNKRLHVDDPEDAAAIEQALLKGNPLPLRKIAAE